MQNFGPKLGSESRVQQSPARPPFRTDVRPPALSPTRPTDRPSGQREQSLFIEHHPPVMPAMPHRAGCVKGNVNYCRLERKRIHIFLLLGMASGGSFCSLHVRPKLISVKLQLNLGLMSGVKVEGGRRANI